MRVLLLTSSRKGTAAHHLDILLREARVNIAMVICSQGKRTQGRLRFYKSRFLKILRIGLWGALNGVRMRKWYNEDLQQLLSIKDIRDLCDDHLIPFHEVESIRSDETRKLFRKAQADLGISLGNGYIPKSVFTIPKYGMINIHHEVLPEFQNAQSVIWQIFKGSDITGYTIHAINEKIDCGEILYRQTVPIQFRETLRETVTHTYALLLERSARGLVYALEHFDLLKSKAVPQDQGTKYTTPNYSEFNRIRKNFKRLRKQSSKMYPNSYQS